jgi:hypothetical protein
LTHLLKTDSSQGIAGSPSIARLLGWDRSIRIFGILEQSQALDYRKAQTYHTIVTRIQCPRKISGLMSAALPWSFQAQLKSEPYRQFLLCS